MNEKKHSYKKRKHWKHVSAEIEAYARRINKAELRNYKQVCQHCRHANCQAVYKVTLKNGTKKTQSLFNCNVKLNKELRKFLQKENK